MCDLLQTSRPLGLVCVDFLSREKSKEGYEDVLVITDHFTRCAQDVACRNKKAKTAAQALYEGFFRFFGFHERLHSDQCRNFDEKTIAEFCKIAWVKKSRTTPYYSDGEQFCGQSAPNCIKHFHWTIRFFWPTRYDVTIVSSGSNCNVKPDWPESP